MKKETNNSAVGQPKTAKTLGDYKGILAHTDFPTAEEIREVMADEDQLPPLIL